MVFEKFIDKDLGQVSYIVGCSDTKEAFIVDPRRDINEYIDFINENDLKIKYILNSHTHADYVGGHIEMVNKYDAKNIFYKDAPITNYEVTNVAHGDSLELGSLTIEVIETRGHTPFDISFLLIENGSKKAIFTGDYLFVGDIGRPDLLGEENLQTLVDYSYDSAKRLWELDDDLMVFTSHIKGSLCGKNLNQQYFSTIGIEKKTNQSFKLSNDSKEAYTKNLLTQNLEIPAFFKKMATLNINGTKLIDDIYGEITSIDFNNLLEKDNLQIIDIREPSKFHKNHIVNSINIYENANVSLIAGNILDYEKDIYLIGDLDSNYDEFIIKILRVGLDNIKGIISNEFGDIDNQYLESSKRINISDISTLNITNILLDKDCSDIGTIVNSEFSNFRDIDISEYQTVMFSCRYGYKSSALTSLLNYENCYILEK